MTEMSETESFRRGIFPYTINGVHALADPLKTLNRIYVVVPEFDDLVGKFFAAPVEGEDGAARNRRGIEMVEAAVALEPAILAGFNLRPLDEAGDGVSTAEAMTLLNQFLSWQDRSDAAKQSEREARDAAAQPPADAASNPEAAATA